jgi:hypothetical protein
MKTLNPNPEQVGPLNPSHHSKHCFECLACVPKDLLRDPKIQRFEDPNDPADVSKQFGGTQALGLTKQTRIKLAWRCVQFELEFKLDPHCRL